MHYALHFSCFLSLSELPLCSHYLVLAFIYYWTGLSTNSYRKRLCSSRNRCDLSSFIFFHRFVKREETLEDLSLSQGKRWVSFASCSCLFFCSLNVQRFANGNTELKALMELKSSLDPTNKVLESWESDGDPCSGSFVGVACNEHRKVANISLQGKGLSGQLSPTIARFKYLSGLYLHYNSLSGQIPEEISQHQELTDLYLNVNDLSGNIPPEIGNMAGLQGFMPGVIDQADEESNSI